MAPRPIWSGTVSFGLVSIPVRMLTATSSRELRFHFVDRNDLEPIGYDKVRKDTGEHVDPTTSCARSSSKTGAASRSSPRISTAWTSN
jgi:non-homologous end joining protein Ku